LRAWQRPTTANFCRIAGEIVISWKTLEFEQCTVRELYLIMRARSAVFVVEQSHLCLDADGRDECALHIFAAEDISRPMPIIAYARVRPGDEEYPQVVLDKVLTSPARRGDGTAELLIERVLRATAERWPGTVVRVNAPVSLCAFYEQFGFRKVEGPFLDYGAPSVGLTCRARSDRAPLACGRRQRGILPGVSTFEKR
jgi:ElaA protein